jgi:acetyl-CoA carboxylase alpha subunit
VSSKKVETSYLEKNKIMKQLIAEAENANEEDLEQIQQKIIALESQVKDQIKQIKEYEKETLKAYMSTR